MRRQFVVGLGALFVGGCGESAPLAHSPQLVATPTASAAPATSADATSGVAHALGAPVLPYPASRRVDAKDRLFGTDVPDPYRWLEDAKAPEVQAWLKNQDDFARSRLKELPERAAFAAREKAFA